MVSWRKLSIFAALTTFTAFALSRSRFAPARSTKEASVRQAKPGLSRKLKGAYPWNNPFIKVAEQA